MVDLGDSIKNLLIRRPYLFYRLLLLVCLAGSLAALVSFVAHKNRLGSQTEALLSSKVHPVFGYDDEEAAKAFAKKMSENDNGKTGNYSTSAYFNKLVTSSSRAYEIKSCLSPDLQVHEEAMCRFFAIMMDAGSTGTRVHIFEFSHDIHDKSAPFKLEHETYGAVSPGLSYYLNDPVQAAKSVLPLLKKAKSEISKSQWLHTPIALKATAGLRLLDSSKADTIITEVDKLFDNSGFLTNEDSVSVMTGIDEGIFGWFTLNFLLDRLASIKNEQLDEMLPDKATLNLRTAAALDLGGGSTQITFKPRLNSTLGKAPPHYIRQMRLFSRSIDLYTHSYLGNGLMAARLASLQLVNSWYDSQNSTQFFSFCLPPRLSVLWKYNDVVYNVSGFQLYNYENCLLEQTNFPRQSITRAPDELKSFEIHAFGYFFDRARQAGLTTQDGAYVTTNDFVRVAKKACVKRRLGSKDQDQFKCRDLCYIIALLQSYGLPDDKPFHLTKKLRNMEVSWALGASYHLLNTYHESKKAGSLLLWSKPDSSFVTGGLGNLSSPSPSMPVPGPCPCDNLVLASGGAWTDVIVNLSAAFLCTRIYHGLISLFPSSLAQFA